MPNIGLALTKLNLVDDAGCCPFLSSRCGAAEPGQHPVKCLEIKVIKKNKMATIKRTTQREASLTILAVKGVLTSQEIIGALAEFYEHDATPHLLWDFSEADLSGITSAHMEQIIAVSKSKAHIRPDGRTALVVQKDLSFGLSRMYETLADISQHPVAYRVFRDKDEAVAWLGKGE